MSVFFSKREMSNPRVVTVTIETKHDSDGDANFAYAEIGDTRYNAGAATTSNRYVLTVPYGTLYSVRVNKANTSPYCKCEIKWIRRDGTEDVRDIPYGISGPLYGDVYISLFVGFVNGAAYPGGKALLQEL